MNERQGPRAIWRESASREYFCVREIEREMMMGERGEKERWENERERERGGQKREIREETSRRRGRLNDDSEVDGLLRAVLYRKPT